MKGLTLSEISEKLDIPVNTLRQRITRLGIKPLTKEALYPESVLPVLANVKMGRPKKAAPEKPVKKGKK
jgi:predicted ArsR family transcriptional regulator